MLKNFKKIICTALVSVMVFASTSAISADYINPQKVKNVIVMIPDGTSVDALTLTRWYNGGAPLAMDELASGLVRTYWANGPITDSAPAATAMATGFKSDDGMISVLPKEVGMYGVNPPKAGEELKPIATVLEAAKLAKKAVGLVSTSEIMHATPAGYSAHDPSRKAYDNIVEQQVYQEMDVVLGGGFDPLKPGTNKENRKDGEDLTKVLKSLGYDYVMNKTEMNNSKSDKIWGAFAPTGMAYDIDADHSTEPTLVEMTQKAINVLSKDKDGFFLMVEGSEVDWAAHANDTTGIISEVLAFDKAVKAALDFAKKDKNTVIIIATDHGNSGVSIGNKNTDSNYNKVPLSIFIDPLKKVKGSALGISKKINKENSNIVQVMKEFAGIEDLTDSEINAIKADSQAGVASVIANRANIGYTTGGHTGEDVALYCYNPNKADTLMGTIQNTDIAKYTSKLIGIDLADANAKLFVDAVKAFEAKGAKAAIDKTDEKNPVLVVKKGTTTLKFPVNKNLVSLNGTFEKLPGVNVLSGENFYVSQFAIDLLK